MTTETRAAHIQYMLKLKGRKQKDVAKRLHVSDATVSQIINGTRRSERIERYLARIVGIPYKALFPERAA